MGLQTDATMVFNSYEVVDEGLKLHFVCSNPGGGENSDYYVLVTDTELATITTQAQLKTLVQTKLQRKFRAQGIAAKLDIFIGQSLTI